MRRARDISASRSFLCATSELIACPPPIAIGGVSAQTLAGVLGTAALSSLRSVAMSVGGS